MLKRACVVLVGLVALTFALVMGTAGLASAGDYQGGGPGPDVPSAQVPPGGGPHCADEGGALRYHAALHPKDGIVVSSIVLHDAYYTQTGIDMTQGSYVISAKADVTSTPAHTAYISTNLGDTQPFDVAEGQCGEVTTTTTCPPATTTSVPDTTTTTAKHETTTTTTTAKHETTTTTVPASTTTKPNDTTTTVAQGTTTTTAALITGNMPNTGGKGPNSGLLALAAGGFIVFGGALIYGKRYC